MRPKPLVAMCLAVALGLSHAGVSHAQHPPAAGQVPGDDPFEARFFQALEHYRQARWEQAFNAFWALAQERPDNRVVGTLGAIAANSVYDDAFVARWTRRADAQPRNAMANYIAGIVMHYMAHARMMTRGGKRPYYRRSIAYLERTLPAFEHIQRVWIYLAVSHHRLGEFPPARRAIARAVALGEDDPDIYYCRAEIMHREDPSAAVVDLERYLTTMRRFAAQGAVVNENKERRVREMLAYVRAMAEGSVPDSDLWDSIDDEMWSDPRVLAWWTRRRPAWALGGGAAIGAAVYGVLRWRRRRASRAAAAKG